MNLLNIILIAYSVIVVGLILLLELYIVPKRKKAVAKFFKDLQKNCDNEK